jgi:hypothetical protein
MDPQYSTPARDGVYISFHLRDSALNTFIDAANADLNIFLCGPPLRHQISGLASATLK